MDYSTRLWILSILGLIVRVLSFFSFHLSQIKEKKNELGKLESIDCGKPLEEALADLVISI